MYTIVVADDEEELRRAIIRKIDWESIGFQVVGEAENGIEALELVERMEPDLLLTDIRMPFVSGIELARQVREVRPTTQIAFLSGFDEFSYAQQAIQYNIISYMLKPDVYKRQGCGFRRTEAGYYDRDTGCCHDECRAGEASGFLPYRY